MQRRETFIGCVFDVCAELAQGIYQNADGALLHTLRAGDDTSAGGYTKIGGEEAHGCPGCHNVYMLRIALQCTYHDAGVVAIAQVVEQYLQLPQVASDFANYLQLYDKYKQVYRVDELLSGTWEPVRASELRDAPFDEKLGVLGLLLSRLADGARDAYRLDALTDALHADLLAIREGEKAIASLPDEKRAALADKRNGGSSDKDALYVASREVERLDAYRQTLMLEKVPEDQQFDRLKALFSADVDARAAAADKTDAELANAFAFLDAAIPDSQELVLFATELTANWFTSWFIQNFGCDAYFAHNKRLLFDDTQKQLLQDIESARNEES